MACKRSAVRARYAPFRAKRTLIERKVINNVRLYILLEQRSLFRLHRNGGRFLFSLEKRRDKRVKLYRTKKRKKVQKRLYCTI